MTSKLPSKSRGWVGILYPDSAPEDWKARIENTHIPALVSPLHDKDKNPDGTLKKAHWHVFLIWESGPTTEKNAQRVLTGIGCIGLIQAVESIAGMTRYLIHADNPEKAQYEASEVLAFNGANFPEASSSTITDTKILREIIEFIREKKVRYFVDLINYCVQNGEDTWLYLIHAKKSYFFRSLIESQEKKLRDEITAEKAREKTRRWRALERGADEEKDEFEDVYELDDEDDYEDDYEPEEREDNEK